jgi:hypothetical protein
MQAGVSVVSNQQTTTPLASAPVLPKPIKAMARVPGRLA